MAAYAAVSSLKNTIQHIRDSSSRISLVPPSSEIIEVVYKELQPLQEILQRLDSTGKSKSRKKVNNLDEQIKEAVWKFEDVLELQIVSQLAMQFGSPRDQLKLNSTRRRIWDYFINTLCNKLPEESEAANQIFYIDMQGLRGDVDSFFETLKDMEKRYINQLDNLPEDEVEEDESWRIDSNGKRSKMVGLADEFMKAREYLMRTSDWKSAYILVGMAGIGKTALGKELFQDPLILSHFECRAWVSIGRKYHELNHFLRCILDQVDPSFTVEDDEVGECLKERLKGKRCLVVLDDVWEAHVLDYMKNYFSNMIGDGTLIKILLTTRERNVAVHISFMASSIKVMRFMNREESETLLCEKVFGEDQSFPPKLEKAGKKIAEICEGLPLLIVTVADHLSKVEKDPEYWNDVAEKRNSVFEDAYDKIYKVLLPSYEYLPQHLKLIFLYIGILPQDYEIHTAKLVNYLIAEGFVRVPAKSNAGQTLENFVMSCLKNLDVWHNLVIATQKSTHWWSMLPSSLKTCRLHSAWRHLCKRVARKNKSFHILNSCGDEGLEGEHRLCVYGNSLLGIKQVYHSVQRDCASTARSLLCFGPYHQYPVPILEVVGFKLLRVLDALKLRFYHFPAQILQLFQLKYLALAYNKSLPPSISKLFNLQFLIIHPHMNIKICGSPSLIPVQVWDMKELKHVEIIGGCLPNPTNVDALENLSTLVGVIASTCTREVVRKTPNLTKLGVQIEWAPEDDRSINPLSCFDHISKLKMLDTLKCSVVNPAGFVATLTPILKFPSSLRKLHLSGLGYPWECMTAIGSLPCLEVLKLRCYAFRGPKWEAEENSFLKLEYLLIEDADLVQWNPKRGSFPKLKIVSMKHCYKLQELHWLSNFHMGRIELVECNPSAVTCAEQLQLKEHVRIFVNAPSSFDVSRQWSKLGNASRPYVL